MTCSYNIYGVNDLLVTELLTHVTYLNSLIKSFGRLQEPSIIKRTRMQLQFNSDQDNRAFEERSKRILQKLKECSLLSSQFLTDKYERIANPRGLDEFYHPELDEKDTCVPKKNLHLDGIENFGQDKSVSPIKSPQKFFAKNSKDEVRPNSALRGITSTTKLYSEIKRKREEAEECVLVREIFQLLQKKAFISDRYGSTISDYDKLELVLRVCERYE